MTKFLSFACVALLCVPAFAQTQAEIDYADALRDQYYVLAEIADAHKEIVDDLLESNDEADENVDHFEEQRVEKLGIANIAYENWMMVGYPQSGPVFESHQEAHAAWESAVFFLDLWEGILFQRQYDLYLANDAYQPAKAAAYEQSVIYYTYCVDNLIEIVWLNEA